MVCGVRPMNFGNYIRCQESVWKVSGEVSGGGQTGFSVPTATGKSFQSAQ